MSDQNFLWITEADVVEVMNLGDAIDALDAGLRLEAAGTAATMTKTQLSWGHGHTLHAIGASFEGAGIVGSKTWAHAGGAEPLVILWDSESGGLVAIIEAFALGQMRTGSMSGLATRVMAAPEAEEMAVIGTGKQALTQVAAVAAVRDLRRLRVFSPKPESRAAFIARLRDEHFAFEIAEATTVESAVDGAHIITAVTRATEPFLASAMLSSGAHVNAVGAIAPDREEVEQDVFARCSAVAVDNIAATAQFSREFRQHFGTDAGTWDGVIPISSLVASGWRRPDDADLTLFKAMGIGLADLSLAVKIVEAVKDRGLGRSLPRTTRAKPKLQASQPKTSAA